MIPLNPFLRAFLKSSLIAQCTPRTHHILLLPSTIFLYTHKDQESQLPFSDLVNSEEFLASHVIRVPQHVPEFAFSASSRETSRDGKSKNKQYQTLNGRIIIVSPSAITTQKGFKTNVMAYMTGDALYYPDASDPIQQPWVLFFIQKPLIGIPEPIKYLSASSLKSPQPLLKERPTDRFKSVRRTTADPTKIVINSFTELMQKFDHVSRQMRLGLEEILKDLKRDLQKAAEKPLPPLPEVTSSSHARHNSASSSRSVSVRSRSASFRSNAEADPDSNLPIYHSSLQIKDQEEEMVQLLEVAITAAIDRFQLMDNHILKEIGERTELTGLMIETLIEQLIAEHVHHSMLFPRVCQLRKSEDSDLEAKMRQMIDIDIAQVGLSMDLSRQSKKELSMRLEDGVRQFKKMDGANSPQEMLDILLECQKIIAKQQSAGAESVSLSTVNADTLVSLLLIVVIRSPIRNLQARLSYMRHFILVNDTESGEVGYALSTFEAVLAYLANDSAGLRCSSMRNRKLWLAIKSGNLAEMKKILELEEEGEEEGEGEGKEIGKGELVVNNPVEEGAKGESNGCLDHVFPFQKYQRFFPEAQVDAEAETETEDGTPKPRPKKKVFMQSRTASISSNYSHASLPLPPFSQMGDFEGDLSISTLVQTQGPKGESVLMMAIQSEQVEALQYLLNLKQQFSPKFVLDDEDDDGNTLLIAAVQTDNSVIIDLMLDYCIQNTKNDDDFSAYIARQDSNGRCVGHYLFHFPAMIDRIGDWVPWNLRDKNGSTPLFALCRSWDRDDYHRMVKRGLYFATNAQKDGRELRLEDHIDNRNNTLLHIINVAPLAEYVIRTCDVDINAQNEKGYTPLISASRYGRVPMVRMFFKDPRLDLQMRDSRGSAAIEIAKDDEMRGTIDDLVLLSRDFMIQGRKTGVIRPILIDDHIRFIVKSCVHDSDTGVMRITTCLRQMSDFSSLVNHLTLEHPASWIPTLHYPYVPMVIPSRLSRSIAYDLQHRLDAFINTMLQHSTFGTHEMVWEFFLAPEIHTSVHGDRSSQIARIRSEMVREEFEPMLDVTQVESFITYAKESVRNFHLALKTVLARINGVRNAEADLHQAVIMCKNAFAVFFTLPLAHSKALEAYEKAMGHTIGSPMGKFFYDMDAIDSSAVAILSALGRPNDLITGINETHKVIEKANATLRRASDRSWTRPIVGGLNRIMSPPLPSPAAAQSSTSSLSSTEPRKSTNSTRAQKEATTMVETATDEQITLGKELRYTQQIVADEMAAWQDQKTKMGKAACRKLARSMLVAEREKLAALYRMGRIIGRDFEDEADAKKDSTAAAEAASLPTAPRVPAKK